MEKFVATLNSYLCNPQVHHHHRRHQRSRMERRRRRGRRNQHLWKFCQKMRWTLSVPESCELNWWGRRWVGTTLITDLAKFCTVIQHNTTILPSVNTVALPFLLQFNLLACRTWPNSWRLSWSRHKRPRMQLQGHRVPRTQPPRSRTRRRRMWWCWRAQGATGWCGHFQSRSLMARGEGGEGGGRRRT